MTPRRSLLPLLLLCLTATRSFAQDETDGGVPRPHWIWGSWASVGDRPAGERCFFQKVLVLDRAVTSCELLFAADNRYTAFLNGARIARGTDWAHPQRVTRCAWRKGPNLLAFEAQNDGGPAGLLVQGTLTLEGGDVVRFASNASFATHTRRGASLAVVVDPQVWKPAAVLAPYGARPWGDVLAAAGADDAPRLEPLPGFEVAEIARDVGSLIALAVDDRDRLYVSVEGGPILRLRDADGDGTYESDEVFTDELSSCQGLHYDQGALYAVGNSRLGGGYGLFRVDDDANRFVHRLASFTGNGGEHGPHAVRPGPDGRLYVALGNHTQLEEAPSASSPYRRHYEGHLLPRFTDPRGHASHVRSPGGTVLAYDRASGTIELFAAGFRNAYDLAFHDAGDLFVYDSDMEWDIGMPWYRPVRLVHAVPGGDYGWRTGSSKWPAEYPDSLPPVLEHGRGSPTGLARYDHVAFPGRFHGALLAGDWSRGRLLAFHLEPQGHTYTGRTEVLVVGRPLNLTDVVVTRGGDVLFTTGGRGTRGAVFRLRWTGTPDRAVSRSLLPAARTPHFDDATPTSALLFALQHEDRFYRYQAARALERRPVATWEEAAFWTQGPRARGEALVALARIATTEPVPTDFVARQLERARTLFDEGHGGEVRHAALRALELLLACDGAPRPGEIQDLGARCLARFPTGHAATDRQLALLLAHLKPEGSFEVLLERLTLEPSRVEQIHLAYALRRMAAGRSDAELQPFVDWFAQAQTWPGGYSARGYVEAIRDDAFATLDAQRRRRLLEAIEQPVPTAALPNAEGAIARDFDRTLQFLDGHAGSTTRDLDEGVLVFQKSCAPCHVHGGVGSGLGPDLTTLAGRFTRREILESIFHPSRQISDQYQALNVWTTTGEVLTGMPIGGRGADLELLLGDGTRRKLAAAEIEERVLARTSIMPSNLLDPLTLEEIADLVAFLETMEPRELPQASGWRPLFAADSLEGWRGDAALWSLRDGTLVGRAEGLARSAFLVSEERWGDFQVEMEVQVETGNSGLQFRSEPLPEGGMRGYQADLGEDYWGSLYEEQGRGMLFRSVKVEWEPALDRSGWNHLLVEARGDRLRIVLNGVLTVDRRDARAASGHLGLQLHAGRETIVRVRHARIRPLDADAR